MSVVYVKIIKCDGPGTGIRTTQKVCTVISKDHNDNVMVKMFNNETKEYETISLRYGEYSEHPHLMEFE